MAMQGRSREIAVAGTILALFAVLAWSAPGYFSRANLSDLFLANVPVLIVALGMTLVILTAEIDVSVGSMFAIAGIASGMLAKLGLPVLAAGLAACIAGAAMGALNGALVAYLRVPSIVVTLAAMIALRDGLRWATQGAWVDDLPAGFQWLGLSQSTYPLMMLLVAIALAAMFAWGLRNVAAGRAVYATGSNPEAARLSGIHPTRVTFSVFTILGALTGLAAVLNSVRFNQIPSNAGLGLEMKVIAAVVIGGTAITGGKGSILGTVLGVILMGAIGPALTFLSVGAYWEKAIQGAIILAAIVMDAVGVHLENRRLEIDGNGHVPSRA
jgi:rhamnose transport system permease protein